MAICREAVIRLLVAAALVLTACGGDASPPTDPPDTPVILTTTSIWADVVANIACDGMAEVSSLVPVGGDPHGFEASLADRAAMEAASVLVSNGLGLEEGLLDTIDAVDGITPVFRMADHVDTIVYSAEAGDEDKGDQDHDHDDDHERDHDDQDHERDHDDHDHERDPHIWFDPSRIAQALDPLADSLVRHAGLDELMVEMCLVDYRGRLLGVDAQIEDLFSEIPPSRRQLVTNHDSLGYLADRYGFEVIGTVIPVSNGLAETSPAQLEALADLIEETAAPALFAEYQHSTDDAEALARRLDTVEVVTLFSGSLGPDDGPASTYLAMLETNAERIAEALAGGAPQ